MTVGRDLLQDLDQVLSAQLAGSTAGRNELREPQVVHRILLVVQRPAATGRAGLAAA
jgi:hypothetical protein